MVETMLEGLSGSRDPLVISDVRYRLAQKIVDEEGELVTDLPKMPWTTMDGELVEVAGSLFGEVEGAAGLYNYDWEYLQVWSEIIDLS